MKNILIMLLSIVLLFSSSGAVAEYGSNVTVENMPESVKAVVNQSRWKGWEITGWVNPKGLRQKTASAFVAVKNGKQNVIVALGWDGNGWKISWSNPSALPQVSEPIYLGEATEGIGFMSYYTKNEELQDIHCVWMRNNNGNWRLTHITMFDPLMHYDTSKEDALRIYNSGWVQGKATDVWIYAAYETNLRYFNLSAFPRTVEHAREILTNPPKIPQGDLMARKIRFTSGQKFKVYQGPGEEYGQAGNGKAAVSTNDWIQVFGEENGWILIQYDINKDHMRIGWIKSSALPKKATVSRLTYAPLNAITSMNTNLTDDPLFSQSSVLALSQGTSLVVLAKMGQWAYVEVPGSSPVRGFVNESALVINSTAK